MTVDGLVDGDALDLARYRWTYALTIGKLDPTALPTSDEAERQQAEQVALLNRCLRSGRIIAKTQSSAAFALGGNGEHQVVTQAVTLIIGFSRRPYWMSETT